MGHDQRTGHSPKINIDSSTHPEHSCSNGMKPL